MGAYIMIKRFILIILMLCTALPNAGLIAMQDAAAPVAQHEQPDECSICLEEMPADQANRLTHLHHGTNHQHTFHTVCIAPVAQAHHPRCPICRRDITDAERKRINDQVMGANNPDVNRQVRWARLKYATAYGIRLGSLGIGALWCTALMCRANNGPAQFRQLDRGWGRVGMDLLCQYGGRLALAGISYAEHIEREWFPDVR